jgi:hypothetical protein
MKGGLVTWMPTPIPFVVMSTRTLALDYTDAVLQVFGYGNYDPAPHGGGFEIYKHMGEVGLLIVSIIKHKPTMASRLMEIVSRRHDEQDDDDQMHIKFHFAKLAKYCADQCEHLQLYDGEGNLHYHFWDWHQGNLILASTNAVVANVPANHWLTAQP